MNFLYYKNFGDEKQVSSSSNTTTYKKKKDTRKSRNSQYGADNHRQDCTCEICSAEYPLRTHLLLDMSFSRGDSDHSTLSNRRPTRVSSMFSFFSMRKKHSLAARDDRKPCVRFEDNMATDGPTAAQRKKGNVNPPPHAPLDPVNLSNLKQDCFMIPVDKLSHFFPAGHPIPIEDGARLRMVETSEPSVKIIFHMIGPAVAFLPSLMTPIVDLYTYQKEAVIKAFKSTVSGINVGTVLQGMVLLNLEKGGELGKVEFPFMIVWVIDSKRCDFLTVISKVKHHSFQALDPAKTGFTCHQYFDRFEEMATLARPPLEKLSRRASTPGTGYIISVFKVFEGDDGQKFERNWLTWSGAKALYCSMNTDVGLRRLTLHKSSAQKGVLHYLLLCDCSNFLPHLCSAVKVVPKLRMRLCGDTSLYRPICSV